MFSLSHAPVPSMHLPVVLSTLPPPLNLSTHNLGLLRPHHLLSAGAFPPVCLSLAAGCHVASCCMPPPRVTFCHTAASCIHPWLPFFVHASHHLRLLRCRCLTTGCVIIIADAQALLPPMRRRLCHCPDCVCCSRCSLSSWHRCRPHCWRHCCWQSPSPLLSMLYPLALLPSLLTSSPVTPLPTSSASSPAAPLRCRRLHLSHRDHRHKRHCLSRRRHRGCCGWWEWEVRKCAMTLMWLCLTSPCGRGKSDKSLKNDAKHGPERRLFGQCDRKISRWVDVNCKILEWVDFDGKNKTSDNWLAK